MIDFWRQEEDSASEHGEAQTGFRLWTQDAKEEWMIDHKGNRWGWGLSTASSALKTLTKGHCRSFSAFLVNLKTKKQIKGTWNRTTEDEIPNINININCKDSRQ